MSAEPRRPSPFISRFAKTLFVAGALLTVAVPAWRTKSLTAKFLDPMKTLPERAVNSMAFDPTNHTVIFTYGRGAFELVR